MKKTGALVFLVGLVLIMGGHATVYAANTDVTAKSANGECNGGGSFDPQTVTITSGDTITFKVPATEAHGLKIQGDNFPEGEFTVEVGKSYTTKPLTQDVDYYAVWSDKPECIKGNGSIVVTGTRSGSTAPTTQTPSAPLPDQSPEANLNNAPTSTQSNTAADSSKQQIATKPKSKNTGAIIVASAASLLLLGIGLFLWYYLVLRPRKLAALPPATQPSAPLQPVAPIVEEPRITAPPLPLHQQTPEAAPTSAPVLPTQADQPLVVPSQTQPALQPSEQPPKTPLQ